MSIKAWQQCFYRSRTHHHRQLSINSRKLLDGKGSERVSKKIFEKYFSLHKYELISYTELDDKIFDYVLKMRNHSNVRKWMCNTKVISNNKHINFKKNLIIFIFRDLNFGLLSELFRLRLTGSGNGDTIIPEISSGIETAQVKATKPPNEFPTIIIFLEFIGLIISFIKSVT